MSTNIMNSPIVLRRKISKILPEQCRICGAPAKFSHYGTFTCEPCKTFFKRNAGSGQVRLIFASVSILISPFIQAKLVCCHDGQCKINANNRLLCPACRLAKCFRCGMTTDKFRPSRSTKSKSQDLAIIQYESKRVRSP